MTVYKAVSIADPHLREARIGHHAHATFGGTLLVPSSLSVPAVAFGGQGLDPAALGEEVIEHGPVMDVVLKDAIIHAPEGVVTVGHYVIAETLNVHSDLLGYVRDGEHVTFPPPAPALSFGRCLSAFGPGFGNHFHFMMEIVTRLRIAPFGGRPYSGLLLLPARLTGPQLEIVGLVGRSDTSMFLHGSRAAIRVAELYVTSALSGDVARPHPSLGAFFASLGSALGAKTSPRRRIYVARRDSANRVLINEDAVIALLSSRGFEIVELVGMTLADQARLFAGSSHIVAPHGAGLTNLVFCAPGVSVCELHMDKYLNWCFRRLCGLRGLNYGCVVGTADGDLRPDGDPHHLRWQIDIDSLDAVLSDVRFRRSGPPLA